MEVMMTNNLNLDMPILPPEIWNQILFKTHNSEIELLKMEHVSPFFQALAQENGHWNKYAEIRNITINSNDLKHLRERVLENVNDRIYTFGPIAIMQFLEDRAGNQSVVNKTIQEFNCHEHEKKIEIVARYCKKNFNNMFEAEASIMANARKYLAGLVIYKKRILAELLTKNSFSLNRVKLLINEGTFPSADIVLKCHNAAPEVLKYFTDLRLKNELQGAIRHYQLLCTFNVLSLHDMESINAAIEKAYNEFADGKFTLHKTYANQAIFQELINYFELLCNTHKDWSYTVVDHEI